jgi:hypothetical protein
MLVSNGILPDSMKYVNLDSLIHNKSALIGLPYRGEYKMQLLSDKLDTLSIIYKSVHQSGDTLSMVKLLSEPFIPSWEFSKFLHFLEPLLKSHSIVISGVSGSGKTTLVDRLAKFVAGDTSRIRELKCVENLDIEYHKQWVGFSDKDGFHIGKLLRYFEQCKKNPHKNYVFVIDDIDKIYPATLFGSEIWSELDNPDYINRIEGYTEEITIPENFYMISVTHTGVGNVNEMNNEHFRRLGSRFDFEPDYKELLIYLKDNILKYKLDYFQCKKILYFFVEANNYITQKYGKSYTLGQWSTLRKLVAKQDFDRFISEFVIHVNSFKPKEPLDKSNFDDIIYTIDSNGIIPRSSFLHNLYYEMVNVGIFSELTVGLGFAIISGIVGWLILLKKRRYIFDLQYNTFTFVSDYKDGKTSYDEAIRGIIALKSELEKRIKARKIKYDEIADLFIFINDQIGEIENTKKMKVASKNFIDTFESFMADGVLDINEYNKLVKFLDSMRDILTSEVYFELKGKIDTIRNESINKLSSRD